MFRYTGEGQSGDMEFKAGNKAIQDSALKGKALHLFTQEKKGFVRYEGELALSSFQYDKGEDKDKNNRRVIVFYLLPVPSEKEIIEPEQKGVGRDAVDAPDLLALRKRAYNAVTLMEESNAKDGKRRYYERSKDVRRYVLARSKGICEACGKPAPFVRSDETPYLEPHHTHMISESGPDNPRWVGAICPNCHRQIHYGRDGKVKNERLQQYITEAENTLDILVQ